MLVMIITASLILRNQEEAEVGGRKKTLKMLRLLTVSESKYSHENVLLHTTVKAGFYCCSLLK